MTRQKTGGVVKTSRRRPGRLRRWLIRPIAWVLACSCVAAALLLWLVHRPTVQRQILDRVIPEVEAALGRVVTVESFRARLFPLSADFVGIALTGPRVGDPDAATIERLTLDVDLPALWRRSVRVDDVEIEGLTLFVEQLGVDTNLPRAQSSSRRPRGGSPVDLTLGSLRILDSRAVYRNLDVPLALKASGIEASMIGNRPLVRGTIDMESLILDINEGTVDLVPSGSFAVGSSGLTFEGWSLQSGENALGVDGELVWAGDPSLELEMKGQVTSGLARQLNYIGQEVEGEAFFEGSLKWRPEAWGFRAEVSSDRLTLVQHWPVTEVKARVAADGSGVWVDLLDGQIVGGQVEGRYSLDGGVDESETNIELNMEGADLGDLLATLGLGVSGVEGRVNGDLNYRYSGLEWAQGVGWGQVGIASSVTESTLLSVSGSAPFSVGNGVLTARAGRVEADGQNATLSAVVDLEAAEG